MPAWVAMGSPPDCSFCAIVAGTSSADVVMRTEHVVGFLDRAPLFVGHVLVVSRVHVATLADLPANQVGDFFLSVRAVSAAIPDALGSHGTFVAINNTVSQSVPHLHAHVVPRTKGDGLRGFFWPRTKYRDAEAAEVAAILRTAIAARLAG
jgi:histidine triad (HIT) family protein